MFGVDCALQHSDCNCSKADYYYHYYYHQCIHQPAVSEYVEDADNALFERLTGCKPY